QDNLFHSMLGLLEVRTDAYDPALDLFAPCRAPEVRQALKADGGQALYSGEASGQEPPARPPAAS
ncbi:phosphoethanolamine transferase, partial [Pseudomonas paraeruginosa]